MDKIIIRPSWQFTSASGERVDPRLFDLLRAIHDTGKLTLSAKRIGLSYRHTWDFLSRWSAFFGSPLVNMTRGKGAYLSPLGEKLLWAEQRSEASLFPHLENIASELNIEVNKHLKPVEQVLRIHASHGYAIEKIPVLMRALGRSDVDLQYMGSVDSLRSLCQETCDLAGFHVPTGELAATLWPHYEPWIRPRLQRVIRLVVRTQGLIVAKGNPLKIKRVEDLVRPNVRLVNRQKGSGTRILFDGILKSHAIDAKRIRGYEDTGEFTHAAVAAFVASGMADVGMAVEPAARQFKLDFVPIATERYMLACHVKALELESVKEMIEIVRSPAFADSAGAEPGYELDEPGEILTMKQAFPWIKER